METIKFSEMHDVFLLINLMLLVLSLIIYINGGGSLFLVGFLFGVVIMFIIDRSLLKLIDDMEILCYYNNKCINKLKENRDLQDKVIENLMEKQNQIGIKGVKKDE